MLSGEDRGTKMLHMYAYRIMELHGTLVKLIEMEKKERDYMRSDKQARLDRMLQERGMRWQGASEAPFTMGDCMFDGVSFKPKEMGMPMSSMDICRAAMRQLKNDYASGVDEVFTYVIPYIIHNGYESIEEYMSQMVTSAICSVDSGRSWADAIAVQWTAKALRLKINVWGEDSHANPPITQM